MIQLGPEICSDLDSALQREWLETNGLGGFASSTVAGANTPLPRTAGCRRSPAGCTLRIAVEILRAATDSVLPLKSSPQGSAVGV